MKLLPAFLLAAVLLSLPALPLAAGEGPPGKLPEAGAPFPPFTLPDVNGKPVSLDDFRGKAILLSFWSCYTDTCFTSARVIENLLKSYGAQGLVAPTVCVEVPEALEKKDYTGLLERCGIGQVVLIDRGKALTERFGITEFPTTFLIDRKHLVWRVVVGIKPIMDEEFGQLVRSLVTE